MRRVRVYRQLERAQELWGLEPIDGLVLGVAGWFLLLVGLPMGLAVTVLAAAYVGIRAAKRGKPRGYTLALFRYAARPGRSFLSAISPDIEGRAEPFNPRR